MKDATDAGGELRTRCCNRTDTGRRHPVRRSVGMLEDIGWRHIPEPSTLALLCAAGFLALATSRARGQHGDMQQHALA